METLELLFRRRNLLYTQWLGSRCTIYHQAAQQKARKAVRDAKDAWFRRKADEAQKHGFGGKKLCQSMSKPVGV